MAIQPDLLNIDDQQEIHTLVTEHLEKLATDASGWTVLYREPESGNLWELSYPHSELHGGGPALLTRITQQDAKRSYHLE